MVLMNRFAGRNREVENGLVDTATEGVGGMDLESSTDLYTLPLLLLSDFSRFRLCATP